MRNVWTRGHQHLLGSLLLGFLTLPTASSAESGGPTEWTREISFKLTFAQRDLTWIGDPASPTALVHVKAGAQPIATDICVTTTVESHESPRRRFMREARVYESDGKRVVGAFTPEREKAVGTIDDAGRFTPNELYRTRRDLLPTWPADASVLRYDARENALFYEVETHGPALTQSLDFLPLALCNAQGEALVGQSELLYTQGTKSNPPTIALRWETGSRSITIARGDLPKVLRQSDVRLGSYDNVRRTYLPEAAYRAGADSSNGDPSVTFTIEGSFSEDVTHRAEKLTVNVIQSDDDAPTPLPITIDGAFDDWRNVPGVDDPRGDVAPYLDYVPDVDLLEFKVSHDDKHIYLYARVAGQVGRSHPDGGRAYFYAYMDVDRNPRTGFLPTRDDDCYFGVDIGDDCEVQFEFVNNVFRKTFYGFCGIGGDDEVRKQTLTIGGSHYGRVDENGKPRANYKSEYIYRDGVTEITEDLKHGTSDTIRLAISPDGSEVEVASTYAGFLKGPDGKPTVTLGQAIDLAAGMESDSKVYPGKTRWGADSTAPIRGYRLAPSAPPLPSR